MINHYATLKKMVIGSIMNKKEKLCNEFNDALGPVQEFPQNVVSNGRIVRNLKKVILINKSIFFDEMRDYFKTPQHFKTCYLYLSNTDHCACISIMVLISKLSTEDSFCAVLQIACRKPIRKL